MIPFNRPVFTFGTAYIQQTPIFSMTLLSNFPFGVRVSAKAVLPNQVCKNCHVGRPAGRAGTVAFTGARWRYPVHLVFWYPNRGRLAMCYVSDKPRPVILHIVPEGSPGDTQNRSSLGFDVTWPMPWQTSGRHRENLTLCGVRYRRARAWSTDAPLIRCVWPAIVRFPANRTCL